MADRFVAVNGSPTNPGTIDAPWSLAEVLHDPVRKYAQPGDTVHVRGGTYRHPDRRPQVAGYKLSLRGTLEAPITVRGYKRERATIDGGLSDMRFQRPEYVDLRELEIIVAENLTQNRTSTESGSGAPKDLARPWGGIDLADGKAVRVINCVIHHNLQGIGCWSSVDGATLYGNIIYENGWKAVDRNHGHGMYCQNGQLAERLIANNIIFDAWEMSAQLYGSAAAPIDRFTIEDNVILKGRGDNRFLIGGSAAGYPRNCKVRRNLLVDAQLQLGYQRNGGTGCELIDNICARRLDFSSGLVDPVIRGNCSPFFITDGGMNKLPPGNSWTLPEARVTVNANVFDADRAHIACWNPQLAATLPMQWSGLAYGDSYAVHRPDGLWEAPIVAGVYEGQPIDLPLDGKQAAAFVLFVDRDPCAAVKRGMEEATQYAGKLLLELGVAVREADNAKADLTAVRESLRIEHEAHVATNSERLQLAQRLESLETQLSAAQSQKALLQTDLTNIGIITDKWR